MPSSPRSGDQPADRRSTGGEPTGLDRVLGQALTARGLEYTPDRVVCRIGDRSFDLADLHHRAQRIDVDTEDGRRELTGLIERWVDDRLADGDPQPPVTPEMLLPRLWPDGAPGPESSAPGYPLHGAFPGLAGVLAVDRGSHVEVVTEFDRIDHLGTVESLWGRALHNLRSLPAPEIERVTDDEDFADLLVFGGADSFVAARIYTVRELLTDALGDDPLREDGLLLALPHQAALMALPVTGPQSLQKMVALSRLADRMFRAAPHPVTPQIYYLSTTGRLTEVARYAHQEDSTGIGFEPELFARLELDPPGSGPARS